MEHIRHWRRHVAPLRVALGLGLVGCLIAPVQAADKEQLPIPRFVSMKHGDVNLRVGPGKQYPITWVFTRQDLPVEIIAEFDTWRKIRDSDGAEGWVTPAALQGKRSAIVKGEIRTLHRTADEQAGAVARLEPGVIVKLLECPAATMEWCRIETGDIRGWLRRAEIWGVYPQEIVSR
jgi:SH3-like domain-containing protein